MRTKLLLTAALVAAGIATSMAQPVYSVNVVGYVNKELPAGLIMIANPLNTTNNTIGALLTGCPDFTTLYKYDSGSGLLNTYTYIGGWDDEGVTLKPGEGVIVESPSKWTNTFVGEVLQGPLTNTWGSGLNILASKVPQAGAVDTVLGMPNPSDFSLIYKMNTTTQIYDIYTYIGGWDPAVPAMEVGESFWLETDTPGQWVRTFTVN